MLFLQGCLYVVISGILNELVFCSIETCIGVFFRDIFRIVLFLLASLFPKWSLMKACYFSFPEHIHHLLLVYVIPVVINKKNLLYV